jgi:hypothetical protein
MCRHDLYTGLIAPSAASSLRSPIHKSLQYFIALSNKKPADVFTSAGSSVFSKHDRSLLDPKLYETNLFTAWESPLEEWTSVLCT